MVWSFRLKKKLRFRLRNVIRDRRHVTIQSVNLKWTMGRSTLCLWSMCDCDRRGRHVRESAEPIESTLQPMKYGDQWGRSVPFLQGSVNRLAWTTDAQWSCRRTSVTCSRRPNPATRLIKSPSAMPQCIAVSKWLRPSRISWVAAAAVSDISRHDTLSHQWQRTIGNDVKVPRISEDPDLRWQMLWLPMAGRRCRSLNGQMNAVRFLGQIVFRSRDVQGHLHVSVYQFGWIWTHAMGWSWTVPVYNWSYLNQMKYYNMIWQSVDAGALAVVLRTSRITLYDLNIKAPSSLVGPHASLSVQHDINGCANVFEVRQLIATTAVTARPKRKFVIKRWWPP